MKTTIMLTLLAFSVIITSPLFAVNKKMRIAIMDFSAKDISLKDARTISELIRNDMINTKEYIVVEREQMNKVLYEQGFQMTGCTEVSCAVEAGKLLSANKILVGSISKLNEKIIITGRIVDVEKGTAEISEKVNAESMGVLDVAAARFVRRLTDRILGKNVESEESYHQKIKAKKTALKTYQRCGYASLAFAVMTVGSAVPAIVFDRQYKAARDDYKSAKTLAYLGLGSSQATLYYLQIMNMKKSVGTMKNNIRARDYSLYAFGGLGALSVALAISTLATYDRTPGASIIYTHNSTSPFTVTPNYVCEPSIDGSTMANHHVSLTMHYRF